MVSPTLLEGHVQDSQLEDELNSVLTWLHPQEHQSHPPSMRLKNSIRRLLSQCDSTFVQLLRLYYYDLVREEYLAFGGERFNPLQGSSFKDITALEKRLHYPVHFIECLEGDDRNDDNDIVLVGTTANGKETFTTVILSLRHYLIDTNETLREYLKGKIKSLLLDDEFESCHDIIVWVESSNAQEMNSRALILDILLEKISLVCEQHFTHVWSKRFLVMEIFNKFISKHWSHFAYLLDISEDDHELTKKIYKCFEMHFIKIRIDEIYDIVVIKDYSQSRNTLLELKKIMTRTQDFNRLLNNFLLQFKQKMMNPSVTTVETLTSYAKGLKCFLMLDPTGKYAKSLTIFVKSFLNKRKDLISILLNVIFPITYQSSQELNVSWVQGTEQLSNELKIDPLFTVSPTIMKNDLQNKDGNKLLYGNDNNKTNGSLSGNDGNNTRVYNSNRFIYQDLLLNYLTWTPEANLNNFESSNNANKQADFEFNSNKSSISSRHDLLDYLLWLIDDKEEFVRGVYELIKKKLINDFSYKFEANWSMQYANIQKKLTENKFSILDNNDEDSSSNQGESSGGLNGHNNDNDNSNNDHIIIADDDEIMITFNKINVMLKDVEESAVAYKNLGLDAKATPIFASSLYWNIKTFNKEDIRGVRDRYKINQTLEKTILRYGNDYCKQHSGRVVKYYKEMTTFAIDVTPDDDTSGIKRSVKVNMPQYSIIEKFSDLYFARKSEYTITELVEICGMPMEEIEREVRYLLDMKLLTFDGIYYREYSRV